MSNTDIFRDTPIRLLGYANEVGEAFRPIIPKTLVHGSYGVAILYCLGDTIDKGIKASKVMRSVFVDNIEQDSSISSKDRNKHVVTSVLDCALWQGLASVAIPGFTINRAVWACNRITQSAPLPKFVKTWGPTLFGLGLIPFIVHPIDHTVDYVMNNTIRPMYSSPKHH